MPGRTATRWRVNCVPRKLVGSDDFGVPLSSKGSVQSVVVLGQMSVSVRYFALEGNQVRGARHPSGGRAI